MIIITLLDLSSTIQITNQNIEFIKDIYEKSTEHYKIKLQQLIDWHKAYHHPFLVERSYKIHVPTNKINNDRMIYKIKQYLFIIYSYQNLYTKLVFFIVSKL